MTIQELREQVAIRLPFDCQNCSQKPLEVDCGNPCEQRVYFADQILSQKVGNLTIKSILEMHYAGKLLIEVEGELPECVKWAAIDHIEVKGASSIYKVAQQDMLKAGCKFAKPTKDLVRELR